MSTKKRDDPIRQTFLKLEDAVNDASKAQMKAQRPYTVSELERYLNQIEPLLDVHVAAQETKATSKSFVDTDAALTNEQLGERYVKFEAWLRSVAPSSLVGDAFTFAAGLKEGSGVIAARDLSEDELFMVIPRKAMLTFETALKSPFGPVIQRDARLTKLHPLATAMHLLFEKLAGETSFWAPYLAILPASYPTPLFARVSEFAALRGSPSYGSALQMVATLIRQYTEMTRLHMTTVCDTNLPNFSFREFRWAVANVMARQNKILSSAYVPMPGAVPITTVALIPGFDSLNHAPAADDAITTSFDWQAQASESFVHVPVKKGDQIYINYESRPNSLLLMYQGFIVAEGGNPNDRVLIRGVQLDLTDPIAKVKGLLLTKLGLLHSEIAIPFLPPTPVSSAETEDASVSGGVVPVPPPYAPLQRWRDVWRLLAVLSMDKAAVSKSLLDLTKATKEAGADGAAVLASGDPTALLSVLKATGTALAQDEPPAEMKEVVYKALLQVLEQSASTAAAAAADGAAVTKVVREGKETEFMALAKALVKGEQELIKKQIELAKEGKAY